MASKNENGSFRVISRSDKPKMFKHKSNRDIFHILIILPPLIVLYFMIKELLISLQVQRFMSVVMFCYVAFATFILLLCVILAICNKSQTLYIYSDYIVLKYGVFSKHEETIPVSKIHLVGIHSGPLQSLFKSPRLTIITASNVVELVIDDVMFGDYAYKLLKEMIVKTMALKTAKL